MRQTQIDDRVRLLEELPHLSLHFGETGVVCSIWNVPSPLYEVEFPSGDGRRAMLDAGQFEIDERPLNLAGENVEAAGNGTGPITQQIDNLQARRLFFWGE